MTDLESRILFFKPMSWLRSGLTVEMKSGLLVSDRLFCLTMGTQIQVIVEKSSEGCGSRKFQLNTMGDHVKKISMSFGKTSSGIFPHDSGREEG
jgi:hypothetical protein